MVITPTDRQVPTAPWFTLGQFSPDSLAALRQEWEESGACRTQRHIDWVAERLTVTL